MAKCAVVNCDNDATWAWQPYGLGDIKTFALLGNHYRGYTVIKVCDTCKKEIEAGQVVEFTYRNMTYVLSADE